MDGQQIIPLFGLGNTSKSVTVSAQRRVNLYWENQPEDDKTPRALYGTPGLILFAAFGASPIRGMLVIGGGTLIYAVQANTFWEIDNAGTKTSRGTLTTSSGKVALAVNSTQVMIVDGSNGYIYTIASHAFVQISDVNFPNGATSVTYIDSYFAVEQPGGQRFYLSQPADGTTWTPAQFSSADSNPDNLLRVFADRGVLHLLGAYTTEFWANNQTGSFPYSRIGVSSAEWGLAAQWSLAKFSEGIIFLATNRLGEVQVIQVAGGNAIRVSNSEVENAINSYGALSGATGLSYLLDGHPFYQLNFTAANKTWLYDGSTRSWSEMTTNYGRHAAEIVVPFINKVYVSDYGNGNLYQLDKNTYTDNGTPIIRQLVSRHTFSGLNRLSCHALQLEFEPGVGLVTGQGNDPQAMLEVSRDGGHTYGNEHWTTIGQIGAYLSRALWRMLGRSRDFTFRITISDPVKVAIANASGRFS